MREKLRGIDRVFWLLDSPNTRQKVQCLVVCDSTPDIEALKSRLSALCDFFPQLRKRVVFDRDYYWEDAPDFSPTNHFEFRLRPQMNCEQDLLDQVALSFSEPFDLDRPLWQARVISNGAEICGFLVAIHHSLADGVGGFELIRALSDGFNFEHRKKRPAKKKSKRSYFIGRGIAQFIRETRLPIFQSALKQENSAQRKIMAVTFSRSQYQALQDRYGGSLNDCLLAHSALALGKLLQTLNAPLPKALRVMVPVSIRLPEERFELSNRLSAASVLLPIHAANFSEALKNICEQTVDLKNPKDVGAYALGGALHRFVPQSMQQRIVDLSARWNNLICSNFPGPKKSFSFAGARGKYLIGSVALLRGHSLALLFTSYADTVTIGIVCDAAVQQNYAELPHYFAEMMATVSAS